MFQKVPLMHLPLIGRNTRNIFRVKGTKGIIQGGKDSNFVSISNTHAEVSQVPFRSFPKLRRILHVKGRVDGGIFEQHGHSRAYDALVHHISHAIAGDEFSRFGGGDLATIVEAQSSRGPRGDQNVRASIGGHDPFHVMIRHVFSVIVFVNERIFNEIVNGLVRETGIEKLSKFDFGRSVDSLGQIEQADAIESSDTTSDLGLSLGHQLFKVVETVGKLHNGQQGNTIEPVGSKLGLALQIGQALRIKVGIEHLINDVDNSIGSVEVGRNHAGATNELIGVGDHQRIFQREDMIDGAVKQFRSRNDLILDNVIHASVEQMVIPSDGLFVHALHVHFPKRTGLNGLIRGGKDCVLFGWIIEFFFQPSHR
mmetsp:Transcript_13773/g.31292  ORF Transcript_13773/g.31292 Transcript_13773/m.31292 type:complete len:368 (+) Transcript_13773:1133-2236(+)